MHWIKQLPQKLRESELMNEQTFQTWDIFFNELEFKSKTKSQFHTRGWLGLNLIQDESKSKDYYLWNIPIFAVVFSLTSKIMRRKYQIIVKYLNINRFFDVIQYCCKLEINWFFKWKTFQFIRNRLGEPLKFSL